MTLEEAITIVNSKPINPWMAYGVYKMNDGYVMASTSFIKRFPDIDYVYMCKGDLFPKTGFNRDLPIDVDNSKLPYNKKPNK